MDPADRNKDDLHLHVGVVVERSTGGKVVNVLRIGAHSDPNKVAGALAGTIREQGRAEMQTIGAGALNQAIKSIAIARGFLAPSGVDLVCYPAFVDVEVEGNERTAIRLFVEPKGH
jgi:stage V sporulation protein S